jgi:hypothetical protein
MKTQETWFYAILLLIGLAFTQTLNAQAPPVTYTDLGAGPQALDNDTVKGSEKWYKWLADTGVVYSGIRLKQNGTSHQLAQAELYTVSSGSLVLMFRDSLESDTIDLLKLYAGYVSPSSEIYIHLVNVANSCTVCTVTDPIVQIEARNIMVNCDPVTPCDLVRNGGFENEPSGSAGCGFQISDGVDCWFEYKGTSDVFKRGCTANSGINNLGTNTYATNPVIDSHNNVPNNTVVGQFCIDNPSLIYSESIQSLLTTPLISGHTYSLSFWAYNYRGDFDDGTSAFGINPMNYDCWVTVARSPGPVSGAGALNYPNGLNVINRFRLTSVNTWTSFTYTFTYSGLPNANILIGPDYWQNTTDGYLNNFDNMYLYVAIDDVSITEIAPITISASSSGGANCTNNLHTYTLSVPSSPDGYTWDPMGVTGTSVVVSPSVTTVYTVTTTSPSGCMRSDTYTVNVISPPATTIVATPSATICPGTTVTLSTPGLSFSDQIHNQWLPCSSGCTTASLVVTPTVTTIYTVTLNSANGCTNTAETTITVLTPSNAITVTGNTLICTGGQTTTLTGHGGSTYTWSPSGVTTTSISVSPTVTTTYTVTGTYACGTATTVTTVSVIPPPTLTVVSSPSVICSGSGSTLMASGALSYTWNPGALTGNNVVVNPTSTTIYTVSGQSLPNCAGTNTVNVTVNSLIIKAQITPNTSTICTSSSVTLTAPTTTASVTYSWSTGATTNSINVTPSLTTVYTLTITSTVTGCSVVKTAVVNVVPAFTVTVNSATICSGSTATLTAGGASTYTWLPGSSTSASIAVSPTLTTDYTVTGTYSAGCTGSMVSTVYVIPSGSFSVSTSISNTYPVTGSTVALTSTVTPPGGAYSYTWSPLGINTASAIITPTDNAVYTLNVSNGCGTTSVSSVCSSIQSTLCSTTSYTTFAGTTFSSSVTYINKIITITGTVTVVNSTLAFYNCTLKMGSNARIVLDPGSEIVVGNSKLFSCEGMWYGIEAQSNSTSAARVSFRDSKIEDAYNAIVTDNTGNVEDNYIRLYNTTFNKNYTDVLLQNWNNAGATYDFSTMNCRYYSQASNTSPGSSLKCSSFYSPSVKSRSYAGIYAISATSVNITTNSTSSLSANTFSNKDYGIILQKTSGSVSNAIFSDMKGINGSCNGIGCTPLVPTGIGIFATTNSVVTTVSISATYAPVTFSNVQCAVYAKKTDYLYVLNTSINNSTQNNWTSNQYGTGYGYNGIYTEDVRKDLHLNYNSIQNAWYGAQAAFTGTVNLNALSISNNTISASSSSFTTTIGANISSASPGNFNGNPSNMPVAANNISGVLSGIRLSGLTGGVRVSGNSIDLSSGNASGGSGVWLDGANTYCQVDNNSINGNATGAENTFNLNKVGITVKTSTDCKVQCNSITNTGTGARYDGISTSPGDGFFSNTLNYPIRRGLELRNSASMGTQGSYAGTPPTHTVTSVSKNQWAGTWNSSNSDQTYVNDAGSNAATSSKLCTGTSASELPSDNQWNASFAAIVDSYTNLALLTSATASANTTCASSLTVGLRLMSNDDSMQIAERDAEYKRIITGSLSDEALSDESKWQLKEYLYRNLSGKAPQDATVINFYTTEQGGSIDASYKVDSLILAGNYSQAQSAANTITGSLQTEQTANSYYTLWLGKFADPEYMASEQDLIDLNDIASICIHKGGNSVAYARSLLSALTHVVKEYDDDCMNGNEYLRKDQSKQAIAVKNNVVNVYPNPNAGSFTLSYLLKDNVNATVEIMDIAGRLIYQNKLTSQADNLNIQLSNANNGIYFLKITNGKELISVHKVIVNH